MAGLPIDERKDGTTWFFAGQHVGRYKSRGFPWTEFEIQSTPLSARFLRLRPLGGPFPSVEVRAPLSFTEARELGVTSATFGTLDRSLAELKEAHRGA